MLQGGHVISSATIFIRKFITHSLLLHALLHVDCILQHDTIKHTINTHKQKNKKRTFRCASQSLTDLTPSSQPLQGHPHSQQEQHSPLEDSALPSRSLHSPVP